MSLNDFLAELAVKYEGLETLYLDIGTPEQQKEEESQALFEKLLVVLNEHIQQVAQTKDAFTQETDRMWDNMQRMNRLMGQSDEAPAKLIDTLANMTLWDRRVTLQEEYTYVYDQYTQKLDVIKKLHEELEKFIPILGPAFVNPGPVPDEGAEVSFEVVQTFSDNIAECEKEQKTRIKQVEADIVIIKDLWSELGTTQRDLFDQEVIEGSGGAYQITDDVLRRLERRKADLQVERSRRGIVLQELQAEVTRLWDKLRIDEDEREKFLAEHKNLCVETIRTFKEELTRLEELRVQKVQDFIRMERDEIIELWMQLRYSYEQQESFTPFFEDTFTEEVLTAHEEEVARLKQEREEAAHVLEIVARYEARLHAIEELEKSTHSADRFNTRGDPGRLLREEKERKQNARELPRLEAELTEALTRWQEEKGRPFLVYGEIYIENMKTAAKLAREGKENEKRNRANRRIQARQEAENSSKNPKVIGLQSPNPRRISPNLSTRNTYIPTHQEYPIVYSHDPDKGAISHSPLCASSVNIAQHIPPIASQSSSTTLSETRRQQVLFQKRISGHAIPDHKTAVNPKLKTVYSSQLGSNFDPRFHKPRHEQGLQAKPFDYFHLIHNNRGSSRTVHTHYDLTGRGVDEDEEMPPRTPRNLKRTAADLSSPITTPPGSPSLYQSKKTTRSASAAASAQATELMAGRIQQGYRDSPFWDEDDSLLVMAAAAQEQRSPSVGGIRSSPFVQQLLETTRYSEAGADETSTAATVGEFAREDSVIEMRKSEAEAFFSTPRKPVVVVDLVQGQEEGSEGWVTDTDDSPQSRRQSKVGRENPDAQTADLAT
ncbi:hypothetical protein BGZ97_011626 [Linnemannia gamsii]|uniref:Microtubule associated protein n=1 Tax=Linnemannia gamsii TaxID=64522 RepID=A0A9P6ULL9_9FUNG|nr:hypothetical protein BGZ97_011626 [Linnemannia gamsii]